MGIHINISIVLFFGMGMCVNGVENRTIEPKQEVRVGVILDLASPVGKTAKSYISMAVSDFYAGNTAYQTRLAVSVKDSKEDVVDTTFAALDLMNNEEVEAIIGPQTSTEVQFVTNLGERAQVPIMSFSATSPSLSPTQSPFFIRTCQDDSSQAKALTSIIEAYGWREVVLIYEDTEYGNGLIPHLTYALQEIDARVSYRSVISPNSNQLEILKQLNQIMARGTRIILVHMTASLGSELFLLAKQAGMMSEGYAWLITDGLSSLLAPLMGTAKLINDSSMHGVLGVRPYLPNSKRLQEFKTRWNMTSRDINLFGLWAYDTVWALAMAAELVHQRLNTKASSFNHDIDGGNSSEPFDLRVSKSGPQLLQMLHSVAFEALSREINMASGGGQFKADFEIINVRQKVGERVIGYWRHLEQVLEIRRKKIVWPGHTKVAPKGWVKPVNGPRLRVGFPVAAVSAKEFVNIEWDPQTDVPTFSGFSYDVFVAVLDKLPFAVSYKLIPFVNSSRQINGTYDALLYQIKHKKFDAVVADSTITANRSTFVDFTLPYTEAGVSMVVKVKDVEETSNIWIFLKPLSLDLWLSIGFAFIYTGLVVWFLERYSNVDCRGPPHQQLGTMFWFSFSTLVFGQSDKLKSKWSRFVLVIWLFVMLIFTQSYTASLASMLTVHKLRPAINDIDELRSNNYYIGYQKVGFVKELLTGQLNFSESKLRPYTSPEEYHDAMSKGSKNGGIDAIFDDANFVTHLLSRYCSKYMVVGKPFKSAGYGFAFPLGSPLVSDFSKAILNITQDPNKLKEMELKNFEGDGTKLSSDNKFIEACYPNSLKNFEGDGEGLSVYSFSGLFIITGMVSITSYLIHLLKLYSPCSASSGNVIHPESSLPSLHATARSGEISQNDLHQVDIAPVDDEDEIHDI